MKVKLKVPSYVEYADLNDHQLVLFAFLLYLERTLGRGKWQTEFIMHSSDFKKITQNRGEPHGTNPDFLKINEYLNISTYNSLNWGISFKPELVKLTNVGNTTDMLKEAHVEITNPLAINHWHYIVGRLVNVNNLINDAGDLFYHKNKKTVKDSLLNFQFARNDEKA